MVIDSSHNNRESMHCKRLQCDRLGTTISIWAATTEVCLFRFGNLPLNIAKAPAGIWKQQKRNFVAVNFIKKILRKVTLLEKHYLSSEILWVNNQV